MSIRTGLSGIGDPRLFSDGMRIAHYSLQRAIMAGNKEEARALVNAGCCPDLMIPSAVEQQVPEAVVALLDLGASSNLVVDDFFGTTLLHDAAYGGNIEILAALVRHGAVLDRRDKNNRTPLKVAEMCGNHAAADYLRSAARI